MLTLSLDEVVNPVRSRLDLQRLGGSPDSLDCAAITQDLGSAECLPRTHLCKGVVRPWQDVPKISLHELELLARPGLLLQVLYDLAPALLAPAEDVDRRARLGEAERDGLADALERKVGFGVGVSP